MAKPKYTELSGTELLDLLVAMRIKEGKTKIEMNAYLIGLGYADSTARDLISKSMKRAEEHAMVYFRKDLVEDISRFESMYEDAIHSGDKKLAVEILQQICKLKGHYVEKKEITGDITYIAKWGDED